MAQPSERLEMPMREPYDGPESLPASASIVIPLILGCAVMGVAVLMAYRFATTQKDTRGREQAEQARGALKESLEAMKARDYPAAEASASEAMQKVRSMGSDDNTVDRELLSTAYLFRGEARAGIGKTEKLQQAVEDYSRCLEYGASDDDRFLAHYGRGQVRFRLGHTREAEQDFTEALKINEYSAAVYGARAFARRRLNDLEGAKSDAQRARELGHASAPAAPAE